tara:strand:+ start:1659 stop:3245 length:1587 start_codon:yes stop_codon:yes gene_type:complete
MIKKNIYFLIIPIISVIGGLWQNQYIYDGYHWGFIFSNSLDFIDGKIPYKEIFLEYGILQTILNSIILIIFNKSVYSLLAFTCILYSLSLYLITEITYKLTSKKIYSLFSVFIIFILYPWPTIPWPNFFSFFFTILFCNLYLSDKKNNHILAGVSLSFAYLSFTTIYNFVIIFFYLITLIIFIINKNKINKIQFKKFYYSSLSFVFVILIFFLYLIINNSFNVWIKYQLLPIVFIDIYGNSINNLFLNYIYNLTIYPIKNFILEPQFIIYSLFFYSNIILIIICLRNIILNKKNKYNFEILIINLILFSLNFYAQIFGIEKLATSLAMGSISLTILITYMNNSENRLITLFIILFISIYSLIFAYSLEISNYGGLRNAHLKEVYDYKNKVTNSKSHLFKNQKWTKNQWDTIKKIKLLQLGFKKKCKIEYGVNLTSNTYYYTLISYKKIQIIPFYFKTHAKKLIKIFEPNLITSIQNQINNNNIMILSSENNDKLFNLENYSKPQEINMGKYKNITNKILYIFVPKKCS